MTIDMMLSQLENCTLLLNVIVLLQVYFPAIHVLIRCCGKNGL